MSELKKPDSFFVQFERLFGSRPRSLRATIGVYWLSENSLCERIVAGETGLVGFCVVWTRENRVFISLEGFLLSLGFLDSKVDKFHVVAKQGVAYVRVWSHSA